MLSSAEKTYFRLTFFLCNSWPGITIGAFKSWKKRINAGEKIDDGHYFKFRKLQSHIPSGGEETPKKEKGLHPALLGNKRKRGERLEFLFRPSPSLLLSFPPSLSAFLIFRQKFLICVLSPKSLCASWSR